MATVKLDPAKGVQIPNMTTTERNAVSSPETGALIWNTTTSAVNQYNGSAWGTVGISEDTTKLPLAGGALTGAVTTNSTFDGVDIATRDAILTSTTTTAGAALPKAGGSMTGDLELNDNVKAAFGQSGDLEIYHDGSHSYIKDVGTGDLRLMGTNLSLRSESTNEPYLNATENGAVTLYYDNAAKLATVTGGVNITGELFLLLSIGSCMSIVCMSSVIISLVRINIFAFLHDGLEHTGTITILSILHLDSSSFPHKGQSNLASLI